MEATARKASSTVTPPTQSRLAKVECNKRLAFHMSVWRLYKKSWKRKLNKLAARRLFKLKLRAAHKIYRAWKRYKHVARYRKTRGRIVSIQAHWRGYKEYMKYKAVRESILKIEACARMYLVKKKFTKIKDFTKRLQAMVRLFLHKYHKRRYIAARKIQNFMQTMYFLY